VCALNPIALLGVSELIQSHLSEMALEVASGIDLESLGLPIAKRWEQEARSWRAAKGEGDKPSAAADRRAQRPNTGYQRPFEKRQAGAAANPGWLWCFIMH